MNDFNNLDVDYLKVDDEVKIYVVPVVAPIIRDEKRRENTIKNFKQTMTSAEIVRSFDLKIDTEDENEPFKDFSEIEYAITDLKSLTNIKENKRFNCDFGLRFYIPSIDEEKLYLVHEDVLNIVKEANVESINSQVEFNQLQNLNDDIIDQLQLTLTYKSLEALEEIIHIELPVSNSEQEGTTEENNDEGIEEDNEASEVTDEEVENDEQERLKDEDKTLTDNNVIDEIDESNEEVANIEILKKELHSMIDALVPKVYMNEDDVEFRSIVQGKDYDEKALQTYKKLEDLTKEEFQQAKNDRLTASKKRRQDIVRAIYEELVPEVWSRSIEADTLLNYKSNKSDYHVPFKEIEAKFEETKERIPLKVEEYKTKIFEEFENDKQYRAEKARKEMEDKIENEERPIVEQRVREYESDLNQKATDIYNDQLDTLNVDVTHSWQIRYSKIVDDVIKQNKAYIDDKSTEVKRMMEDDLSKTLEDRATTNESLRARISKLEEARINDAKNFEERVEAEVKEMVNDYELRDKQMNEEIRALRTDLQTFKEKDTDSGEEIRRLQKMHEGDQEEIRRLSEKVAALQQESYNATKEAMEIQRAALSIKNQNFSDVAASSNGVGNLPDDVAEKVKRLENRKKGGFITWISGLLITVVLGSGVAFNANAAQTQQERHDQYKSEQQEQKKQLEERDKTIKESEEARKKAEEEAKAEKAKADKAKAEKDKKDKSEKKKDDKK